MSFADLFRLAASALVAHRLRSLLTVLGIVVGITSVTLLTSLGEGTRSAVLGEFTQFGTHLIGVQPGKLRTTGVPASVAATVRKLTLDDAEALMKVPGVVTVVPIIMGSARVEGGGHARTCFVYGSTSDLPDVWRFHVRAGSFLPSGDSRRPAPLAVLGPKLKQELFGDGRALGERVRVGAHRFLVIGVMEPKGQFVGLDMDDAVYVPVAAAQRIFNREELEAIDVTFSANETASRVSAGIRRVLMARHGGEEDFTIITQDEMLEVLGRVLSVVGVAVAGIGGISLLVGAIGILTMMWISVGERTAEIGLVKALGGTRRQVVLIFLLEATLLSLAGGLAGVGIALLLGSLLHAALPAVPFETPPGYVAAALALSVAVGLVSGVLPARRAARLDPVEALRAE